MQKPQGEHLRRTGMIICMQPGQGFHPRRAGVGPRGLRNERRPLGIVSWQPPSCPLPTRKRSSLLRKVSRASAAGQVPGMCAGPTCAPAACCITNYGAAAAAWGQACGADQLTSYSGKGCNADPLAPPQAVCCTACCLGRWRWAWARGTTTRRSWATGTRGTRSPGGGSGSSARGQAFTLPGIKTANV